MSAHVRDSWRSPAPVNRLLLSPENHGSGALRHKSNFRPNNPYSFRVLVLSGQPHAHFWCPALRRWHCGLYTSCLLNFGYFGYPVFRYFGVSAV